jgi:hypothetical protein
MPLKFQQNYRERKEVPISKEKSSIDVGVFSLLKRMKDKLQEECATGMIFCAILPK